MDQVNTYLHKVVALVVKYGGRVALAIIVLILGLALIKRISRALDSTMVKRNLDPSPRPFVGTLLNAMMKIMLVISIASTVGIEITSFVAILGAADLAIGFALQGSLSNFAGGALILTLKPYKVGDLIEFSGKTGFVREIEIFVTKIETFEHIIHIIPNNQISSGTLTNYSEMPTKRQDWVFGISYGAKIDLAKETLLRIALKEVRVLQYPTPQLLVSDLADSSANITVRVWVKNKVAPAGSTIIAEKVKKTFGAMGVGIPFPQLDLHFVEDKTK